MTDLSQPARFRVSVDLMSGDGGAPVALAAARLALRKHPDLDLLLCGNPALVGDDVTALMKRYRGRIEFDHAEQIVRMDDLPSIALRKKRQSSMRYAVQAVKDGRAHACVSAGNTGALMAIGAYILKTLPGVDRPAIVSKLPSAIGGTYLLDMGANLDCSAEQLFQFAVMGAVLAEAVEGVSKPAVGLLNVGAEETKGSEPIKLAAQRLRDSSLNYVGFVEGGDIFVGDARVVVADGFAGNVALKSSEGVAKLIISMLKGAFAQSALNKAASVAAAPVLKAFAKQIDPGRFNGATFIGLDGVVIKSHGSADAAAFANAIDIALAEAKQQVPSKIGSRLATLLDDETDRAVSDEDAVPGSSEGSPEGSVQE